MPFHAQRMSSLLALDKEGVSCRVVRRQHAVRDEVYGSSGSPRRRATAVQAVCRGGLDYRFGAGHGEERT